MRRNIATTSTGLVALLSLILIVTGCLVSSAPPATVSAVPVLDEPALLDNFAAAPPAPVAAPKSIAELRAQVAAILERERVPGVGLALVDRNGLIWAGGVGVADHATQRPVDADTVFRVASITKSVVGLGVMRLVEQGRLELEAPLRERMPEIELGNAWADSDPITLAHALEHTAGFDDMRFNEWWGEEATPPAEALSLNPRSRVARWRPGSRMSYSNPGYTIAGYAIELASGEPWDRWLEREILAPVGMPTASFRRTPALRERLATGYVGVEQPATFTPMAHAPAGALLASPRELAALVHFWLRRGALDRGRIVSPAGLDRIERSETPTHPGTDANYGLGNYGDVMHPVRARGHDGGLPGFLSCYRYFPELGVGYVMLLNATHSVRAYLEIRALLFAYLSRDRELPAPPIAPPDEQAIAAAVGYYGFANPRIELTGFIDRALVGLTLQPSSEGVALELLTGGTVGMVPTGDGGFRHPSEGGTSVRLGKDAEGRRILVIGMAYFEAGSGLWARTRLRALQSALLLMQLALIWALGWVLVAFVRRLRGGSMEPGELGLHLWPGLASLSFFGIWALLQIVVAHQACASANALSIALCLTTLAFPACSSAAVVAVISGVRRAGPRLDRVIPGAAALACFGMTLWLLAHGIIGLRVWAW